MAVYAQLADGRLLEFPDGTTPEVMEKSVKKFIASETPAKEGVGAALVGGAKRFGSAIQTAAESILDPTAAAKRGLERGEEIGQEYAPGASLEAVKKAYAERGLFPAAGEAISQIPSALAEQAPNIAATLAGARAGARFGLPGAAIGAAAPAFAQLYGSALERQAEAGMPEVSRGRAAAAAVPGAALEVASTYIPLGRGLIGKLLGPEVEKALAKGTNESIERLAKESLGATLAKGAGVGALAEIPTEVTQQILERAQAGLPLTTPDALAEYGEAAYGAGLVGGPFGAVGRVGQRGVARGQVEEKQAGERRLQEELATAERAKAEEEEVARKQTPEYRQELNSKIVSLKDELQQVEPIAKDKTVDEDVRNEAIARAKEIKDELKDLTAEMKASMKEAGAAPTLAAELAKRQAAPAERPIVDEFGNIVKPKKAAMTEEEYAAGYEKEAVRMQERNELLRKLREKEEAEAEAKRQKTYEETQQGVQNYLAGLEQVEETNTQVLKQRLAEQQQRKEEDVAQEITLDRINLVLENFGLRAAGVSPEVRKLVESKIDEGVVDRTVTRELGIQGLEGRTYRGEDAVSTVPNIKEAINKLETQREKALVSKQELMDDKGQLTPAGYKLVGNEAKLRELKRLQAVIEGRTTAETPAEVSIAPLVQAAVTEQAPALAENIDLSKPLTQYVSNQYKAQAEEANKAGTGAFLDLAMYLDDYQKGRFFGMKGAKRDIEAASYTREGLLKETENARKQVIDALIREVSYQRVAEGRPAFTRDEAIGFGTQANNILEELINRGTALPSGQFLQIIGKRPAQMRGDKIVRAAEDIVRDSRDLKDRQFGAPARAVEVLAESINQLKKEAITSGVRPVRKGKFGLTMAPRKAAPTDLIKDLDRVLRMENLQPEVAKTLEAARRRMEEGGASEGLEDLVEEQVGRILRGTDRPFTLERDVTQPGGRRAMAAAGTAELVDEINTQLRFDAEQAQFTGEQMTTVPKGREFRETRVQPDLFPETVATERATPQTFQRLQKSQEVRKAKAKEARLGVIERAAKKVARERELTPEKVAAKEKQLMDRIAKIAYDFRKNPEDLVSTKVSAQWAALDEDIKKEVAELKDMKAKLAKMSQGTPEQRAARAAVVRQQKLIDNTQSRYDREDKARDALMARAKAGLGLPGRKGISVVETTTRKKTKEEYAAEMKAYRALPAKKKEVTAKPTKYEIGTARRVKVVPIKSKEEIAAEVAERQRESLSDLRRKAKVSSPEAMYNKLKEEEKAAAELAKIKTYQLNEYVKAVNEGKAGKNFPKFKKMSAEVDAAKANLSSIRENLRLLKETQYEPEKVKRQPARGAVGGEVPYYDKKFTPDQLRNMSGLGLSAYGGPRTFSVDDVVDFRIGDTAGGGIDLEQANKRMDEVEKKLPKDLKFKYFPTMKNVTVDILKSMERQGVDIYETRIRGGVKPDGTVFIIGENHTDMTDLEKTIAHEFIGHYTFEGMMGEDGMTKFMLKIDKDFATKDNESGLEVLAKQLGVLDDYAEAVASAGKFYAQDLAEGKISEKDVRRIAKTKGLREIIAYTMEKRVDQDFLAKAKRWIQELVGAVRAFFKKLGMDMDFSTSDLFYMMKQANKSFEEGKPIAYRKADGGVDFRFGKPKYNPGMEDLGAITDKIVGRQQGMWDSIKANTTGLASRVQFVDRFAALEALGKRGVEKGIINSLKAQDMMYFARMADQRHAFVAEIANNGGLKLKDVKRPDGRMEKIVESDRGASLKDISQALLGANVGNAEATGRLFTLYLAAERAQRVGIDKLNFGGGITEAELKKVLALGQNEKTATGKAFQKARELYNEYNRGLIDFAVQTGALSKKEGTRLSNTNDYVPFYRMRGGNVELIIGGENPIRIGDIKSQQYLQELVGGDEAIMDFFTSSLQNTTLLTDMALRNLATRNAAFTLADLGVLEKKGDKGSGIRKGDGPANPNTIRFKLDGEDYHAVINTEAKQDLFGDIPSDLVVKGMEGIKVIVPGVVRALATPANWLRKFVTRDPRYAVRQIFRDSMAATLTTGANMKPVIDTMGEIVKMYGKGSETFQKLQRRGVLGGQVITGAPEDMAKIMQQIASGKPGWDLAMAKLDAIAMKGDAGTRMAMYNSFLKQGLSEREATLAALESMNFGRRGVSPSIYFLNATIPFFNAGIQGIDVLYRAFTKQMPYEQQLQVQKKLLVRGGMMALLTLGYFLMMQDDEAYKNAEPEQRYGNWFVRIPGFEEPFKVPIPFEVGLLFKAIPEGVYNAAFSDEKGSKIAKDLGKQLLRSLPGNPADAGVPIPTAVKPLIETALNMSFFTGRDIVDARLERVEKEFQYRDKTPEILKVLGPVLSALGLSPVQVENIIRGYTGAMGVGILSVANPVLKTGAEAGAVEGRVSELPLVGGLFQPNDAGRVINEAYESVKEVQQKQGTYKQLIAEGKLEEAESYIKKNISDIGLASYAGSFRQQMGELTKVERAIKAAPGSQMGPEEKRKQLDELRQVKIQMAQNFKAVREQIERQAAR